MFAFALFVLLAVSPAPAPPTDTAVAINTSVVMSRRGDFEAALAALDAAPRTPATAVERARVLLERSQLFRHDPAGVDRALDDAESAARAPGADAQRAALLHLRTRVAYGRALDGTGPWEGVGALLQKTREALVPLRNAAALADNTFYRGLAEQQQGRMDAALPLFREALVQAENAGDKAIASFAERHIGFCLEARGDVDGAEAAYSRSIALRREEGMLVYVPFALVTHAALRETLRADSESALRELREAARTAAATNNRRAEVEAHLALARLVGRLGGAADAAQHLESAERAARQFGTADLLEEVLAAKEAAGAAARLPGTR